MWSAASSATSCAQSGIIAQVGLCNIAPTGRTLQFTPFPTQTGTVISSSFFLPLTFTMEPATVAPSGALTFGGSATLRSTTPVPDVRSAVTGDGEATVMNTIGPVITKFASGQ